MICDKIGSFFASNLFSLIFPHFCLIVDNELTGSIPTEVGLLTELTALYLSKHFISIYLLYFETKHIHLFFASDLFSLIFPHFCLIVDNELTGSIPTEIGLLTGLTELGLGKRLFLLCFYAFNFPT